MSPQGHLVAATTHRQPRLSDTHKTEALRIALRDRYSAGRYAVVEEMPQSAGFTWGYCDAMVLALWPSDRHKLHGFELKASRSDWKRDLGKAKKHHAHIERCNTYTLFTYSTAVARVEELPEGWGWWALTDDGKIQVIKRAAQRTPVEWTRGFVATLVRRAIEASPSAGLIAEVAHQTRQRVLQECERNTQHLRDRVARLEAERREGTS